MTDTKIYCYCFNCRSSQIHKMVSLNVFKCINCESNKGIHMPKIDELIKEHEDSIKGLRSNRERDTSDDIAKHREIISELKTLG